jgi:hypothetical protein
LGGHDDQPVDSFLIRALKFQQIVQPFNSEEGPLHHFHEQVIWLNYLWGYVFSLGFGGLFLFWIRKKIWKTNEVTLYPELVGHMERFIFTSCILLGMPDIIGIWLAIKGAGSWSTWSKGKTLVAKNNEEEQFEGIDLFCVFLIQSGFSIIYGVGGALLSLWILKGKPYVLLAAGILVVSVLFVTLSKWKVPSKVQRSGTLP